MAIDPVCKTEYEGKTYYFCAAGCKSTFEENPKKFPETMETKPKKKWWQFWK